ncbi:Phosphatidylinositol transfer protein (PITP) [Naganishia albida]|nr:Phosphatidylinositol transfer protein (PITP) [Naganishia albida]
MEHSSLFSLPPRGSCRIHPKPNRLDTQQKRRMYEDALAHFSASALVLDSTMSVEGHRQNAASASKVPLSEEERKFLTRECLIRHLLAEKWNYDKAIDRLERSLVWRRAMGVYDVQGMAASLENEAQYGKAFMFSYSPAGQPLMYWFPEKHRGDPEPSFDQVRLVVYLAERASDLMVAGVEEVGFIVDLTGKIEKSSAQINVARGILQTMQTYYPEKLGFAMVQNLGFISKALVNIIWPFVDAYTKEKVQFDVDIANSTRVHPDLMMTRLGGNLKFEYDLATYWPDLLQTCLQRRSAEMEKWRAAGGRVGVSESDFKVSIAIHGVSRGL